MEVTSPIPLGEGGGRHFLAFPPLLVGFDTLNSGSCDLLDLAGVWVAEPLLLKAPLLRPHCSQALLKPPTPFPYSFPFLC